MTRSQRLLQRPHTLWLRWLTLQAHLWLGLSLGVYLSLISVTGSILVFRVELEKSCGLQPWGNLKNGAPQAAVTEVIANLRSAFPDRRLLSVFTPTREQPYFVAVLQSPRQRETFAIHPGTARVLGVLPRVHSWLSTVGDLHTTLLSGVKGRMANGVGAAFLLLINITGLVIWWPGIKRWRRSLFVDLRRNWRGINFDLHRAVGFWALSILSFWAISGFYFGWPRQVFLLVNRLSPIVSARPPAVKIMPVSQQAPLDLASMLAKARALDPGAFLQGINFPYNRRAPLEILLHRGNDVGREYTDTLYFNPGDGSYVQIWRYGINQTAGDWFIWSQVPLHFGTYWGLGVKLVWATLGLAVPLLTITGILIYWNRTLRHKRRLLRVAAAPTAASVS